jgi:hypothetical protein
MSPLHSVNTAAKVCPSFDNETLRMFPPSSVEPYWCQSGGGKLGDIDTLGCRLGWCDGLGDTEGKIVGSHDLDGFIEGWIDGITEGKGRLGCSEIEGRDVEGSIVGSILLSEEGTEGTSNDGAVEGARDGWWDSWIEGVILVTKEEADSDGAPLTSIGLTLDEKTVGLEEGSMDGGTERRIVGYLDRSSEGSWETCPEGTNVYCADAGALLL